MDQNLDTGVSTAPPTPMTAPADTAERVSTSEAARILAQLRHKREPEAPVEAAPAEESPAQAEDAGAVETQPPSETEVADPVQEPPIEPPRSWTKEDKELFAGLPRETQERLAERERSRDTDFSRRQNEAAEKLKGLSAKEQAVEQARQQYESALPLLLQNLQSAQSAEFSDIKSMVEVQKMAAEDWPRYIRWDAQQKQIAATQQEIRAAEEKRTQEHHAQWNEFAKRQDDKFLEVVPDMADTEKATKLQKAAIAYAKGIGFTEQELADSYHGKLGLSARDYRFQVLLRDATLWREAQQARKEVARKPVPPVQRPGVSQPKGAAREAEVQALSKQIDNTSGIQQIRKAAALLKAQRDARR